MDEQRESLQGKKIAFFGEFAYWPGYHCASPADVAREHGAVVWPAVDVGLDYLVLGDKRGNGKAAAKRKAEKLALSPAVTGPLKILSEADYRELVRIDLRGKSFFFAGGFDCCPKGLDDDLLGGMVAAVGGTVAPAVHSLLDYLVLGNRRGAGKTQAERIGRELSAGGWPITILDEASFLEMVRKDSIDTAAEGVESFAAMISGFYGLLNEKKVQRALKMLQSESFQLYSHVAPQQLCGIVKSQTRADTVYAPWINAEGLYGCYTQELDPCMGMQGSICKHLLVLLLGLTRSGQLPNAQALSWVQAASSKRPKANEELSTEAILQYRGAVAGEIDWRPTETVPEDFYF